MSMKPTAPVASPCISVCRLDEASGLCVGCLRTLDEIAAWSLLDDDGKRDVIAALPARRAAHPEFAATHDAAR
jgi:predicted Fe-S protein YdhL (DUF1289 family)